MKVFKTFFRVQLHSPALLSEKSYFPIYSIQHVSFHKFNQKKRTTKRAKWKIIQLSTHIMRKEANKRGEAIRDLLLSGYNVRVEIYEKSIQDPETPPGDAFKLKAFMMGYFSDIAMIENQQIRKTYGVNLISQMAFDIRLIATNVMDDSYNTQTLHKLQKWTEKRSDITTLETKETKLIKSDKEMHSAAEDNGDTDVIDYIDEEVDNTVGYFKDWNKV
eukprot:UN04105